jgi:uncharacterized protein YcbK (DUF882 family)
MSLDDPMRPSQTKRVLADPIRRRAFLRTGLTAVATITALPVATFAEECLRVIPAFLPAPHQPRRSFDGRRELAFYNIHTDERLRTTYWEHGSYVPDALQAINYFFRDYRANEVKPIDPRLLDLLFDLRSKLGGAEPFDLISGYRSAATNAWLAARSEGVAHHSMHIEGKAADVHLPGVALESLQSAALALSEGGVGYYPRSGFVHVDTGRVRRW